MEEGQGKVKEAKSFKESQGRFARDPVAAKEAALLGGEATRRSFAKRRTLREAARTLLNTPLTQATESNDSVLTAATAMLQAFGVEDPTGADALMLAQFVKACKGDTEASRFVRDTAGERPSDQVHLIATDRPIDADSLQEMTDEELALLAKSCDTDVAPIALPEGEKPVVSTG